MFNSANFNDTFMLSKHNVDIDWLTIALYKFMSVQWVVGKFIMALYKLNRIACRRCFFWLIISLTYAAFLGNI